MHRHVRLPGKVGTQGRRVLGVQFAKNHPVLQAQHIGDQLRRARVIAQGAIRVMTGDSLTIVLQHLGQIITPPEPGNTIKVLTGLARRLTLQVI